MYCSHCFKKLSDEFLTHACMPKTCSTCFQSKENILEEQCFQCSGMAVNMPPIQLQDKQEKYKKELETYTNLCKDQRFDYKTFIEKKLYKLSGNGETEKFKQLSEFYRKKVIQKTGDPPGL